MLYVDGFKAFSGSTAHATRSNRCFGSDSVCTCVPEHGQSLYSTKN